MELYEPLIVEHRIIERLFTVVKNEVAKIQSSNKVDSSFINTLSDFFITYIDVYHHGKEENILFKALEKKPMNAQDKSMMNELLEEHKIGRRVVEELIKSTESYVNGDQNEINNIISRLTDFISIYDSHIKKEDKLFFIPCMKYFNQEEKDELLQDFWRYTIKLMDKKYEKIIDLLEGKER